MRPTFSAEQLRWFRQRRSGLVEPFATPEAVASHLVGVQAQFLVAGAVALWNRVPALDYATVERRLYDERTLVKLWGQRHTLHLYPSAEWPLIQGALSTQATWREERLERSDDPEAQARLAQHRALVVQTEALLRERPSLGRSDLRASTLDLDEWHLSAWGGLFSELVRRGHAVHARPEGGEGRFAHRERWLPELAWAPPPADEANTILARRYLAAYGPATLQDFAYWRGTQLTHARRWFKALSDELVEVASDGRTLLLLREDLAALDEQPPEREGWPVRLLYRFDPLLLALRDKSWIVDRAFYNQVWRPAGHIEGTILEHGRLAGTWRYDRRGGGLELTLRPFAPLPTHARAAVERAAEGIAAFFALPLVGVAG